MSSLVSRFIGIMSGNSLDAIDIVITEFSDNLIQDIGGYSLPVPSAMAQKFRCLKKLLANNDGDIQTVALDDSFGLDQLIDQYMHLTAQGINEALHLHHLQASDITAIGFHGQTCAHCPPSIAKSRNPRHVYTLQIGDGQMLADLTGITVVYDFRSDDLMNFGEAAPLAPVHNQHIAACLQAKGIFPVAFCNGGNTGNIAIISSLAANSAPKPEITPATTSAFPTSAENILNAKSSVIGFDTGPFNHFVDYLVQTEKNLPCDFNGQYGCQGKINFDLLQKLFEHSVKTKDEKNFLLQTPPKSSDPAWYKIIHELTSDRLSFEDRIRTAEYFSSYIMVFGLKYFPENLARPNYFLVFGGGWRNPVILEDFKNLMHGIAEVLPCHQKIFDNLKNPQAKICWSDEYGYSGQYMEARIFADMARCKLLNIPFSYPQTTGCTKPTVGGIIAHPGGGNYRRWSRAAKGWGKSDKGL